MVSSLVSCCVATARVLLQGRPPGDRSGAEFCIIGFVRLWQILQANVVLILHPRLEEFVKASSKPPRSEVKIDAAAFVEIEIGREAVGKLLRGHFACFRD